MKKSRHGFTLIEVSLFLAITAVIFVGIVAGTQSSIFQQRYNDAVQSFADFLRNNYSQVTNVQSDGTGMTDHVIYGRMITFGNSDDSVISYSIIGGDVSSSLSESLLGYLADTNAAVGIYNNENAGLTESYMPKWGSRIQVKNGSGYSLFRGAIMIVRHPETGSVYTYVTDEYNEELGIRNNFENKTLDLCVNPNGEADSDFRKDVRVVENAKNSSGVVLVPDDAADNGCK